MLPNPFLPDIPDDGYYVSCEFTEPYCKVRLNEARASLDHEQDT